MKNKVILILSFVAICSSILSVILFSNNNDLIEQLNNRDSLIRKNQATDSLTCEHNEKYVKTIKEYITNDCSIIINDKTVTLDEFIEIYSDEITKSAALQDSLTLLTKQMETISRRYGIKFVVTYDGKYRYSSTIPNKVDTALILMHHFKDKLGYDTINDRLFIRK